MKPWESEFVELLSLTGNLSRADLTDEEFRQWLESDKFFDAHTDVRTWHNAEKELKSLKVGNLRTEIRRRIKELGGGPILYFWLKHDFTIRLRMDLKSFRVFKERADKDPVLKVFSFTHRGHGKKERKPQGK